MKYVRQGLILGVVGLAASTAAVSTTYSATPANPVLARALAIEKGQVQPRPHIWLDIGTREGPQILRDVENFRDVLLRKGWRLGRDLHYERVEGAEHNEAAWSQRVGPVLQFLFPAANSKV